MSDTKKQLFLACIKDCVANAFYYDRKEDEEINSDDVQEMIDSGGISLREIVETFQAEIIKNYPDKFKDELEMAYMFKSSPPSWLPSMPPPPLRTLNEFTKKPATFDVPFISNGE